MLNDSDADGEYKIPFLVVCDAFQSETIAFADLVLPDTTYLERHDVMSMLDRPISEFDGPGRLGARSGGAADRRVQAVPGSAGRARVAPEAAGLHDTPTARASSRTIPTSSSTSRPSPARASASSSGWRGEDGERVTCRASRTRSSGRCTRRTTASSTTAAASDALHAQLEPRATSTSRKRRWAGASRTTRSQLAALLRHAAELPPRRAGQDGRAASRPTHLRERIETLLRSAAVLVSRRSKHGATDRARLSAQRDHAAADGDVPLVGLAERVAAPDPQPQLPVRESAARRARAGIADGGWCWVEIAVGQGALHGCATARRSSPARCGPGTRSARPPGAWQLAPDADEARKGFLLNHLITEELPARRRRRVSATPIRSPARPAGTTCACASGRPRPTKPRRPSPQLRGRCPRVPGTAARAHVAALDRADSSTRGKGADSADDAARARHRPQRLRRLPRLRHLAARNGTPRARPARSPTSNPYGADPTGTFFNRVQTFEVGAVSRTRDGPLPEELPALRGPAVRAGVPDRRELQARGRRHRAGRLRQVHRLQVLRVGLPLRRARARRAAQGDDEVHAVRRPHLRRERCRRRTASPRA